MLFVTIEQLIEKGVKYKEALEASQIEFSDRVFTRVEDLSKQDRQTAINLAKQHIKAGIFSFIAESDNHLTIWKQEQQESITESVKFFRQEKQRIKQLAETTLKNTNYQIFIRQGAAILQPS